MFVPTQGRRRMWRAVIPSWWTCSRTRDLQTYRLGSPRDKGSLRHLNKLIALGQVALVMKCQNIIPQAHESTTYFTLASRNYASFQIRSSTDFSQGKRLVLWSMFMSKKFCLYSIWKWAHKLLQLSVPIHAACSHRTTFTPTFTTPTWIEFWLNNQSYFEGLV